VGGTLLIEEVQDLDAPGQVELLRWFEYESTSLTLVVALTCVPLYPRVQAGTFLDVLYYRLNVIYAEARRA
jgi:DNA-binding NtrC family response regulator